MPPSSVRLLTGSAVGLALAALVLAHCTPSSSPKGKEGPKPGEGVPLPEGGTFSRKALLQAFGGCVLTNAREFQTAAETFAQTTDQAAGDPSKRTDAREAWKKAINVWQKLEVMQFGPAAMGSLPGGQEIRESIYSWPLGGRCLVEQNLVSKGYESAAFAQGLINTRGLLAAEYLLFYDGTDNACAPTANINTSGGWAALGAAELLARKAAYAKVVVADVASRARALVDAWDPAKGNFLAELTNAGAGSKAYATDPIAFNSVSDAMFYIELATKDMKVARPAGLTKCTTTTCPEALESPFALHSKEHVRNNLLGFRMLFSGCKDGGLGFDDYLHAVGQGELAGQIDQAAVGALAAVDAIDEPDLLPALSADLESVRALHAALKRITHLLKTQFAVILQLQVPSEAAGDTD
jgi:predicted lipoprotein